MQRKAAGKAAGAPNDKPRGDTGVKVPQLTKKTSDYSELDTETVRPCTCTYGHENSVEMPMRTGF